MSTPALNLFASVMFVPKGTIDRLWSWGGEKMKEVFMLIEPVFQLRK